jgi:hypothetical protein
MLESDNKTWKTSNAKVMTACRAPAKKTARKIVAETCALQMAVNAKRASLVGLMLTRTDNTMNKTLSAELKRKKKQLDLRNHPMANKNIVRMESARKIVVESLI